MVIDKVALTLTVIGALNWGSIGLFGFDLVAFLCGGQMGTVSRVIYTLVGLAGVWGLRILVGRSNVQNDALTRKADKRDLWLHTQKIHGSHASVCASAISPCTLSR